MTAVWSLLKRRVFFIYMTLGFFGAVGLGSFYEVVVAVS